MRRFLKLLFFVFLLVAIDQFSKLLVSHFFTYDPESLMQVKDTVHIHPLVNHSNAEWIEQMVQKTGIDSFFWKSFDFINLILVSLLFHFIVLGLYQVSVIANFKKLFALVYTLHILIGSTTICALFDRLFWDGTQDFLCISKSYIADSGKLKISHLAADIKDCYLDLLVVLLFVYVIQLTIDFSNFSKNKAEYSLFKQRIRGILKKKNNKNGGSSV